MLLKREQLKIFPDINNAFSLENIHFYLVSLFGDGIVSGFDVYEREGSIIVSPGTAIVDGVVIMHTQSITLPYSTSIDKDVMLINKFSDVIVQRPEIVENYVGEKPYIYLYSISGGVIDFSKRKYSLASKNPETFGFLYDTSVYNDVVSGSTINGDQYHNHSGVYNIATEKKDNVADNTIVSPPENTIATFVTPKSIKLIADADLRCYIDSDNRVRTFCTRDGVVVSRGTAMVTFLVATFGTSS